MTFTDRVPLIGQSQTPLTKGGFLRKVEGSTINQKWTKIQENGVSQFIENTAAGTPEHTAK